MCCARGLVPIQDFFILHLLSRLTYIQCMSNKGAIEILYEDDDILAVNKPAGLIVHDDGRSKGPFLTDWIAEKYPEAMKVGEPARNTKGEEIARPGIVHRLDRETSGVLLVAKTAKALSL